MEAPADAVRSCPLNPDGSLNEPVPPPLLAFLQEEGRKGTPPVDLLHAMQTRFGYLSERYLRHAAVFLHLTRFALHRLLQTDPAFCLAPPGVHRIRVCRAESCSDEGSQALMTLLENQLGLAPDETTPNGHFSLETAYCFGLCSHAPVMDIDGVKHRRLTPDRAWQLVQDASMAVDP